MFRVIIVARHIHEALQCWLGWTGTWARIEGVILKYCTKLFPSLGGGVTVDEARRRLLSAIMGIQAAQVKQSPEMIIDNSSSTYHLASRNRVSDLLLVQGIGTKGTVEALLTYLDTINV